MRGFTGAQSKEAAAELRARGERMTPQRLLVLEAMRGEHGHFTAEAIYARVRASYPYINLATIYRSLNWLKDQGLVSETDLGGGHLEYEYLSERRHHHLVCLRCGQKQEFADDVVAPLAAALHERYSFAPRLDHLAVFGRCRGCQEPGSPVTDPTAREP